MGFFNNKNKDEKEDVKITQFLLENEEIEKVFGIVDKVYVTNKRIIFKDLDLDLSLKAKKILEIVFINLDKIDGFSYVETTNLVANRIISIKSRGFSHDMKFSKVSEKEIIDFCKYLSQKILDI